LGRHGGVRDAGGVRVTEAMFGQGGGGAGGRGEPCHRAHLSVQAATKIGLTINLKTAKALGLEVPSTCSRAPMK
jgi:hypothetical protein